MDYTLAEALHVSASVAIEVAVLFVMMGLQLFAFKLDWVMQAGGLLAIVSVLATQFFRVALPVLLLKVKLPYTKGAIKVLTWGGLRGGISIALARSIPE